MKSSYCCPPKVIALTFHHNVVIFVEFKAVDIGKGHVRYTNAHIDLPECART